MCRELRGEPQPVEGGESRRGNRMGGANMSSKQSVCSGKGSTPPSRSEPHRLPEGCEGQGGPRD